MRQNKEISVGDVVLVHDDNLPRANWKLTKVLKIFPGKDNNVKTAKIQVGVDTTSTTFVPPGSIKWGSVLKSVWDYYCFECNACQ